MRFSEAIRLGAMLRPKARHAFYRHGRSCALGAALEAMGIPIQELNPYEAREAYFQTDFYREKHRPLFSQRRTPYQCPHCSLTDTELSGIIIHLNNEARWSRFRIAKWVETMECELMNAQSEPAVLTASRR